MRVSQRLDYALRTIVLLAAQPEGACVPAGDLADRLSLPRRFVEQQMTALARAGIVESRRGSTGGAVLSRSPSEITAYDVVRALEGSVIDVPRQPGSAVAEMWIDVADTATERLKEFTVADLLERQRELDAQTVPVYYI